MARRLKYVDLFAGCGGLSLGLEQAGFSLVLAVEKSNMAAETFYHNFVERIADDDKWRAFSSESASVLEQAEQKLVVKGLSDVLECKALLHSLKEEEVDLVAGGPPCQGFSLAGRRDPDDIRNRLPWQFLEFVKSVEPKAVLIENVSGISQDFKEHGKKSPFQELRLALEETGPGYCVQPVLLNAMHFGVPQHRPRIMLLALRKDIAGLLGPAYHFSEQTWKSDFDNVGTLLFPVRPKIAPVATHFGSDILTVADAIGDLDSLGYDQKRNFAAYAKEMRDDVEWMPNPVKRGFRVGRLMNHKFRKHAEHIETRFRLYQYFRDEGIQPKILGIPKMEGVPDKDLRKMVDEALGKSSIPAVAPDGVVVAMTRKELISVIMDLGTRKHSQRPLSWNAPSPTVVSLPDDFVHPEQPRTLTVREMARFQSFPDAFEFRSKETTGSLRRRYEVPQYTQVGNAVPPKMARAVGLAIRSALTALAGASASKKAS
jgi:DNA (cytosine-5)-methyltransferase 1